MENQNFRVLLYSRDPGGSNTILPLIDRLIEKNYIVLLYGDGTALQIYQQNGYEGKSLTDECKGNSDQNSITAFLIKISPDFIITGTSLNDYTEKYLWKSAHSLNIPSFAILDQWMNYGIRFSKYSNRDYNRYLTERDNTYLPTKIILMDEIAKKEAEDDKLPQNSLLICGQPHFEKLVYIKKQFKQQVQDEAFRISFISEPFSEVFPDSRSFWGYDEFLVLDSLINSLNIIQRKTGREFRLTIKLHPKESETKYNQILGKSGIKIEIIKNISSINIILNSELVCGISSMVLLEANILGKPVISIQLNMNREDSFILAKYGLQKSITSEEELLTVLEKYTSGKECGQVKFPFITDPIERIIEAMEKILCQN